MIRFVGPAGGGRGIRNVDPSHKIRRSFRGKMRPKEIDRSGLEPPHHLSTPGPNVRIPLPPAESQQTFGSWATVEPRQPGFYRKSSAVFPDTQRWSPTAGSRRRSLSLPPPLDRNDGPPLPAASAVPKPLFEIENLNRGAEPSPQQDPRRQLRVAGPAEKRVHRVRARD